jgi:hypothetical protein
LFTPDTEVEVIDPNSIVLNVPPLSKNPPAVFGDPEMKKSPTTS